MWPPGGGFFFDRAVPSADRAVFPSYVHCSFCLLIMTLSSLGWNAGFSDAFQPFAAAGLEPARVALVHKHSFILLSEAGERSGACTGRLLFSSDTRSELPAVGDWVAVRARSADTGAADIHAVLPRRTCLRRRLSDGNGQVLAANIDTVFLVSGLDQNHNPRRLERFLAAIRSSGAEPVLLLNKADLHEEVESFLKDVSVLAKGVPVIPLSALLSEDFSALNPWLQAGRTVALLGSSGVGKSTLLNRLVGARRQETSALSLAVGKGRHTTTSRELIQLPGGALMIDNPGLRELQLADLEETGMMDTFPEVAALAARCRFHDCVHQGEPGCAVLAALADGSLSDERWQSYRKLQREAAYLARREDPQLANRERARWKRIHVGHRQRERFERRQDD